MSANWNNDLHWNIVDVQAADGLLHYGRVIDCAEKGLMIDFGDGKAPEKVCFGHIYCCTRNEVSDEVYQMTESCPVNVGVLFRLQSDEPAKWYPGVLLTGDFDPFGSSALVRIAPPDGASASAIVSGNRIRCAQELGQLLVEEGQFVKEEFELPSGVSSGLPSPGPYKTAPADQRLVDRFNSNCARLWMVATHIDGGVLHVLRTSDQFHNAYDDCRKIRDSAPNLEGNAILRMIGMTAQMQRKRPNDGEATMHQALACSTPSGAPTKLQFSASARTGIPPFNGPSVSFPVCQPNPTSQEASSTVICATVGLQKSSTQTLRDFPRHVLVEIFECLDGVPLSRLCSVCSRWNDILTSLHMSRLLRVLEKSRIFWPCARVCLLKRWTAQTKIIIYSAVVSIGVLGIGLGDSGTEEQHYGTLLCSGRFFNCIFQEKQVPRLNILVLDTLAWECSGHTMRSFSHFVDHIRTELNSFASVCHCLVVRKLSVMLSGGKTPIAVRLISTRIVGSVTVDTLWELLDKSQPPLSRTDLACWAKWISGHLHNDSSRQLLEILNEIQSADPRDTNQFRGKEWTPEDLANVNLEKLNRITSHSLVKAYYHTRFYEKFE